MARKPKTVVCVFCGQRGAASGEDVIPKWIARHLAAGRNPPFFDLAIEGDGDEMTTIGRRHIGGLPAPYKLPEVCKPCNEGWMSNLEQGMKHAGKRLIEGTHYLLSAYEQVVLATWMTKTALLYDVARGGQVVPPDKGCHQFYATGQPLPRSQIMIAAFQPPDQSVVIPHRRKEHKLIDPATGDIALHGVDISFVFGFLLIQLYVTFDGDEEEVFGYPTANPNLIQCWPVRRAISWQPPLQPPPPSEVGPNTDATEI